MCRGCGILSVGRTSMIDTGLQGKVVVVTGANHGIGAATPKAFADQGARVFVHYLRMPAATSNAARAPGASST